MGDELLKRCAKKSLLCAELYLAFASRRRNNGGLVGYKGRVWEKDMPDTPDFDGISAIFCYLFSVGEASLP